MVRYICGMYFYVKALHIIFVVTWFSGLFYVVRLFIYNAEAEQRPDAEKKVLREQLNLMTKRLWYGITWPSAIITFFMGVRMLMIYPLFNWLIVKLCFVVCLYLYHISLQVIFKQQSKGIYKYSGQQLRLWNEVPTIILFAVVFLVVLKNTVSFWYGLLGLFALVLLLMTAIRIYKRLRKK